MYSDGIILRQTVGQPSNTFLFLGNEGMLRQGFQQPFSIFNDVHGPEHLEFIVFPNPTFGRITISMAESIETYSIRIESIMGSLVKEISNQTSTINDVDLNGLMPGIYLLTIQSGQRLGTSRVVLTR